MILILDILVLKDHPFYEHLYNKIDSDINCHGGLTFSRHCDGNTEKGICHFTKSEDDVWWFGFDCGHAWDISPNLGVGFPSFDMAVYRDLDYVTSEVEALAKQLKKIR